MHHWKKKKIQLERSSGQQLPHWKKKKKLAREIRSTVASLIATPTIQICQFY